MHTVIGDIGHIGSIAAFIFSIISVVYYFRASKTKDFADLTTARLGFLIHAFGVITVVISLFFIIYNHYYEYHYAWSHSSNDLPTHYMISCFWEGQEGSFLLWTFWNVVLCFIILFKRDSWEPEIMLVMMTVQVFLSSMLLGVAIGDMKFGSSPFILLKEVFYDAEAYKMNPNFVPLDGNGLNPLLQNYWMVIHPPTLFLGFSLTQIPFALAMAGLLKGEHKNWIRKAFSWTLICAAVLGIGIMMGAYWAYETLNFGGYWNWDPVENAVYVPWLIVVALLHTFTINEKKNSSIWLSYILSFSVFILVLYSTFLTRSGILGSASVHSFTDLGLSGQLLLFLLFFVAVVVGLLIKERNSIPTTPEETKIYTPDFWMITGVIIFGLGAFQVLAATSFPVFNSIGNALGFNVNLAQPADQVNFYGKFQAWIGIGIALASSIGQYLWWIKGSEKRKNIGQQIGLILFTLFIAAGLIVIFYLDVDYGIYEKQEFDDIKNDSTNYTIRVVRYILLFASALLSLVVSGISIYKIRSRFSELSGGALAHIGVGLMLLGFLFSSGYSKVISVNDKGKISNEFTAKENNENILLYRHEKVGAFLEKNPKINVDQYGNQFPEVNYKYNINYRGRFIQPRNSFQYINLYDIQITDSIGEAVVRNEIDNYNIGDTIYFAEENTYHKVDYEVGEGKFTIYPRTQSNPSMGGLLSSPDVKHSLWSDIYSYVATARQNVNWSDTIYKKVSPQDTIFINDYVGTIEKIVEAEYVSGVKVADQFPEAKAVTIIIKMEGKNGESYYLKPSVIIESMGWRGFPDVNEDVGASVVVESIPYVTDKNPSFTLAINTTTMDFIVFHAEKKPLINFVWIGTLLVSIGFILAAFRRRKLSKLVL